MRIIIIDVICKDIGCILVVGLNIWSTFTKHQFLKKVGMKFTDNNGIDQSYYDVDILFWRSQQKFKLFDK